jgi:peptidoglycan/LPS O-acetylase OafA/YrhL
MQGLSLLASSTSTRLGGGRRGGYRPDIDGLRGLAIALVVIFHVFVGRVSSGVDVFLLVGGI